MNLFAIGLGQQMEMMGLFWKVSLAVLIFLVALKLLLARRAAGKPPAESPSDEESENAIENEQEDGTDVEK